MSELLVAWYAVGWCFVLLASSKNEFFAAARLTPMGIFAIIAFAPLIAVACVLYLLNEVTVWKRVP